MMEERLAAARFAVLTAQRSSGHLVDLDMHVNEAGGGREVDIIIGIRCIDFFFKYVLSSSSPQSVKLECLPNLFYSF